MSRKLLLTAIALTFVALSALSGCPPNAYHILTLTVTPVGGGTIQTDPERSAYFAGAKVSLEALPNEGYVFQNWIGNNFNTTLNPTTIQVYADQVITAVFRPEGQTPAEGEDNDVEDAIILNGGFESGALDDSWLIVSNSSLPVICSAAECGLIDGLGPASGQYWAWLGNEDAPLVATTTLSQFISMPSATRASLLFNIAVPESTAPFRLQVLMNNQVLWEISEESADISESYAFRRLDISNFATGRNAALAFAFWSMGYPTGRSTVFLDNVMISIDEP